jgi:hypothetical protein
MRRWTIFGLLILAAPFALAQDIRSWVPEPFVIGPYGAVQTTVPSVPGQESRALAIGDGHTALGIYVFNHQGHCVGFDDEPTEVVYDDRIVSWVATAAGPYEVQFRNLGPGFNRAEAAAK